MSTVINGTYCNVPGTTSYGLNLTCAGPSCAPLALTNYSLPLRCKTSSSSLVNCAMNVSCAASNFTNQFRIEQKGNVVNLENQYTLNGTWGINGTSFGLTTSISLNTANASQTNTSTSGGSTSQTAKSLAAAALVRASPGLFSSLTALGTIILFSNPVWADDPSPITLEDMLSKRAALGGIGSAWTSVPSRSQGLLFMEGDIAKRLSQNGQICSPEQFLGTILDAFLSNAIPAPVNFGLQVASGQYELATKSAVTTSLQGLVDATLLAGAAETGGLSLLAVWAANAIISSIVDAAFAEGDHFVAQLSTTPSTSPSSSSASSSSTAACSKTANVSQGLCNYGDFASSPLFYQENPFGSQQWDDCGSCCVAWSDKRFGGACLCCILGVQHTPGNNCCDNEPGFMDHCCSVGCGLRSGS